MTEFAPFQDGEQILLIDQRGKRHLIFLRKSETFHSDRGWVPHDAIIGQPEGSWVRSSMGLRYIAVRPTLAEYVLEMPRGAQVIYPKDLAVILFWADIYPGCRVLEAGMGSGALTLALLLLTASAAHAVITKLTHLAEVLETEDFIFVAGVDKVDPDKPAAVFKFEKNLKGEAPFERMAVNMTGTAEAQKAGDTKTVLDRLDASRKVVFFVSKRGKKYNAMAFVEGSWFSMQGTIDEPATYTTALSAATIQAHYDAGKP